MKRLLTILFICLLQNCFAIDYYFSSSTGNDSNPGTQASPYASISKLNTLTLAPGDNVYFKRGDTFSGSIIINQSGTSGNPITFGAYGIGANPVFNGLTSVASWTSLGSNIWESTDAVSSLSSLKLVLVNGVNTPMGSYPNRDDTYPFLPNYLNIEAHTGTGLGTTTISNSNIIRDWTGADIVVRVNHWTLDKEPITGWSDTTLTYSGQAESDPVQDGWGFWIQNDVRTLDRQNEWYYDPSTKKLKIYSSSEPQNVQVTTVDTMIYARVHDYITITGIDFKGANNSAIVFSACNNPVITNCHFQYTGATAIEANDASNNLDLENSAFYDIGGACIWNTDGGANWVIKNNIMQRIGLVSVIKNNDYSGGPVEIFSPGALVQYNHIDSTAYEGIHFRGNNVQIRNNFVNHTSMLRDDGGGIYSGFKNETGKIIDGNIVINSIGNARGVGTADAAGNGIYMDGLTVDGTVTNNTVAHIVSAGIFLNNDSAMSVHGNTVYDAGGDFFTKGCLMVQTYNDAPYASYQRNMNVTNNIFFQKRPSQVDVFYYTATDQTNKIQDFGILDSNWYAKATDTTYSIIASSNGSNYQNLSFSGWQTFSGKETNGHYFNQLVDTNDIKFVYNASQADSIVSLGANYKDVKGVSYPGNITLSPYTSAVLVYDSPISNPPSVTTSGNQSITATSTNIFSTPVAGSGHTITSVQWTQISGPSAATIGTPTTNNTNVSALVTGTYIFRITVTQDDGQTAYAEVTITVTLANENPVANAGTDQTIQLPTNSVTLSGSGTDADGTIVSYQWTKISGTGGTITSATSATTTVTGLTEGSYQFQLTVTDNQGATATDIVHVTVNAATVVTPKSQLRFRRPTRVKQL